MLRILVIFSKVNSVMILAASSEHHDSLTRMREHFPLSCARATYWGWSPFTPRASEMSVRKTNGTGQPRNGILEPRESAGFKRGCCVFARQLLNFADEFIRFER